MTLRVICLIRKDRGYLRSGAVLHDATEQKKERAWKRRLVSVMICVPLTSVKSYLEAPGDGALDERGVCFIKGFLWMVLYDAGDF